jgi:protein phosphatase-4 regulatory subunit 3
VRPQNEEARIVVLSEDDQNRELLLTRISKDDGYQKQQGKRASSIGGSQAKTYADTLIVWTEQNGTDMALSFQEPEGCASIW